MKLKFEVNTLVRPSIKSLVPYASARDEFQGNSSDMLFLDANENPFENGINRYPDPQQNQLKSSLSEIKKIPHENILLGNGSDEVLDLIFRAFCEPNEDNIIILPPTYGMYRVLANVNAIATKEVPLDVNFQPQVENILSVADSNSKILFLCSPNNPTGNSLNRIAIEELIKGFHGIVVIDEAYIDFSNDPSWMHKLNEYPNLVITQTLSKAYGMAGIRLGICYASKAIIAILNRIKPPYNINELTQQKAIEQLALKNRTEQQITEIINEKSRLIQELETIDFIVKTYPSDANFILVKVDKANLRYEQLLEKGIVVRNRTTQIGCENCLRLTVGTPQENKILINALNNLNG